MTLQSTGSISLSDIQTEFGGANPTSISEYYRGGTYTPNTIANLNIPTSGSIAFSNFYGSSGAKLGITWTTANSGIAVGQSLKHMAANTSNTIIVAAQAGNVYLSSNYGSTWTLKATNSSIDLLGCEFALGNWYVVDYSDRKVQRSSDGTTWTTVLTAAASSLNSHLIYNDGYFVLASGVSTTSGYIYGSTDGTTWVKSPNATTSPLTCGIYVSSLNRTFVGGSGVKYYNGIPTSVSTWTGNPTGISQNVSAVAWSPTLGYACVVNNNARGGIFRSADLITWTSVYSGVAADNELYNIKWCENQFIAVGAKGTVLTSYDSTTWTPRTSGAPSGAGDGLYGIGNITSTTSGSALFIGGKNGVMLRSL